jgi:hypothetical protein
VDLVLCRNDLDRGEFGVRSYRTKTLGVGLGSWYSPNEIGSSQFLQFDFAALVSSVFQDHLFKFVMDGFLSWLNINSISTKVPFVYNSRSLTF